MFHVTSQAPLPGDLVIRETQDTSGIRPITVFGISVWPHADLDGGPYPAYGYALRQARTIAMDRGVCVWREVACDENRLEFDNVSAD